MKHWIRTQLRRALCLPPLLMAWACGGVPDDDTAGQEVGQEEVGKVRQQVTGCVPEANQCAVFRDVNFGGSCAILGTTRLPNAYGDWLLPNDTISSVKCGEQMTFKGCEHSAFRGLCLLGHYFPDVGLPLTPLNDKISSIEVMERSAVTDPAPFDKVKIWVNSGCSRPAPISGRDGIMTMLRWGEYWQPSHFGLADNSISSFEVGSQAQVYFCRKPGLDTSDVCEVFGPGTKHTSMSGLNIGNDTISSISVSLPF